MTTIIDDAKRVIGKRTTPPRDAVTLIAANELEPLAPIGRHAWWNHRKYGELRERPATMTDADLLPDRILVQSMVDGERSYRIFDDFDIGTHDRILTTAPPSEPKAKPSRPADRLNRYTLLTKQSSQGLGTYRARGCAAILARPSDKGHTVVLDSTGAALWWTTAGIVPPGLAEDLAPLLVPYLQTGVAPRCTAPGGHPTGVDDEAVTPVAGGGLSCAWHLAGGAL